MLLQKRLTMFFTETTANVMGRGGKAKVVVKKNGARRGLVKGAYRFGIYFRPRRMHTDTVVASAIGPHARLPGQIVRAIHVIRRGFGE